MYAVDFQGAPPVCIEGRLLRMIDDDGRQVVAWDWTELKTPREAPVDA